jgi:hypothetical protein
MPFVVNDEKWCLPAYGGFGPVCDGAMRAGHQDEMVEGGNAYLDWKFPKLDKLIRATIVPLKQP